MSVSHILGFPRIGAKRELKFALEGFWRGEIDASAVEATATMLKRRHWDWQKQAGLSWITVGDFALYDQVLSTLELLGALPTRYRLTSGTKSLTSLLGCARGTPQQPAMEMTKWFDTNYHYLVPEWTRDLSFEISPQALLAELRDARQHGCTVKPVLLGPLSLLFLGKPKAGLEDVLMLLPALIQAYCELLSLLKAEGCEWLQIDEPILGHLLSVSWQRAFKDAYQQLAPVSPKILLTTYFADVSHQIDWAQHLPVAGWHLDLDRAPAQLGAWLDVISSNDQVLSCGVVNGRNIWRCDLPKAAKLLDIARTRLGERVWVASSCSLLHVPITLEGEDKLCALVGNQLAFAREKLQEIAVLRTGLALRPSTATLPVQASLETKSLNSVQARIEALTAKDDRRNSAYSQRSAVQAEHFRLPQFPTTTIGSFPQTPNIRAQRAAYKRGDLAHYDYLLAMRREIAQAVTEQEILGLDVIVHGEAERNDMVEYFGEQLLGYAFSINGWVQSYGSRCVKPPIIYSDVARLEAMTVEWTAYAQSLTQKPVKGMLTGPVTLLQWSFVREDLPRSTVALQLALAIRDEVRDLERAGVQMIQIDEPAFREGLPLNQAQWPDYLEWATRAFRVASSGVSDQTQIHTHMCYSEFEDILPAIAALDADVITIETSRSDMSLLKAFERFNYPNAIGPGVYDIHSPRVPTSTEMRRLIDKACEVIPAERLWINPDCGLKTRDWPEVRAALQNMVCAAQALREERVLATSA